MRLAILACGFGLVSPAHSAIMVTNVTVHHDYSGVPEYGTASTPLANASPGNHFTTYDGRAGATLDINNADGNFRVSTWGSPSSPYAIGYSFLTCSGTMRFTAVDGDFTATPLGGTSYTTVNFTLTQLATGASRAMRSSGVLLPSSTGTLAFPAPAGEYELSWTSSQAYMVGTTRPGSGQVQFAITPEPATLSLFVAGPLFRRRRS